jgi:hypothetical protein
MNTQFKIIKMQPKVKDYRLKPLKQFYRPYFSPYINSYELDYVKSGTFLVDNVKVVRHYLAVININTKYLFMEPLAENTSPTLEITTVIVRGINEGLKDKGMKIEHLRGDGDTAFGKMVAKFEDQTKGLWNEYRKGKQNRVVLGVMTFVSNQFTLFCKDSGITLYLNSSKFVNKNRVVDRVIRTIRDKLGTNAALWLNPNIVAKAVQEYNNTKHSAFYNEFSPIQVQHNKDLEEYFIREQQMRLQDVTEAQKEAELYNYIQGNILLIHLDFSKTDEKFKKQRRTFNQLAEFVKYDHGNVNCFILERGRRGKEITLPIYYTKFVSTDLSTIPNEYKLAGFLDV